ncbi:hypothetical protein LIS04_206 [Listeria phage LIS04]|nr:hypothetical protein LIS04_206 [Listeria phage LIS04]
MLIISGDKVLEYMPSKDKNSDFKVIKGVLHKKEGLYYYRVEDIEKREELRTQLENLLAKGTKGDDLSSKARFELIVYESYMQSKAIAVAWAHKY